jgi:hypothetical protein
MTRAELWRAAATSIARFWNLTRNHVFRELPRLQAQGLIEAAPPRPHRRQPYRSRRQVFFGEFTRPEVLSRALRAHHKQHQPPVESTDVWGFLT